MILIFCMEKWSVVHKWTHLYIDGGILGICFEWCSFKKNNNNNMVGKNRIITERWAKNNNNNKESWAKK